MVKRFNVIVWCVFFLVVIDLGIGVIIKTPLPTAVRDRDSIHRFLKETSQSDALFLGSSRARDLDSLVGGAAGMQLRILSVSGGHISTFLNFVQSGMDPHFRRIGAWPKKMVLVIQPLDFEATTNENIPSILWGWRDFIRDLSDGIGEPEKNFLRNRFLSWMRYSSLARDRNHRDALSKVVQFVRGKPAVAPTMNLDLTRRLDNSLARPDPREVESLHTLVAFLQSRAVDLKILLMPFAPSAEAGLDSTLVAQFRNYLHTLCAREGCEFQALTSSEADLQDSDFTLDLVHLNPHGRKVIGNTLLSQGILAVSGSQ